MADVAPIERAQLARAGLPPLEPRVIRSLADALQDARVRSGTWAAASFVIRSDGADEIVLESVDLGPIVLTHRVATELCVALARSLERLPRDAQQAAADQAFVRRVRTTKRQPIQLRLLPGGG